MKHILDRSLVLIALSSFAAGLTPILSSAYDLSADTLMIEGGERQEGTIDIKGEKYRIQREGEPEYIVLRHDLGVMWVVIPGEKAYLELPLDPRKTPKIKERNSGEIDRKYVGTEVTDGHPTVKYEITVREGAKTESFYQWTASDLDFPVKTAARDGGWVVEFKNIRIGVPDSLFEIPEGYDRVVGATRQPGEDRALPRGRDSYQPLSPKRASTMRVPLLVR